MPTAKKVDGGIERTYKVFVSDEALEKEKVQLEREITSLQEQITIRQTSLTEIVNEQAL